MNAVGKKLRSSRGASIILGMFVLLVCTVVTVIMLRAQTASAGRISQIVRNDIRYYSVSSASDLLRERIDGQTVSLYETKTVTKTTTTNYAVGDNGTEQVGTPQVSAETSTDPVRISPSGDVAGRDSILSGAALDAFNGEGSAPAAISVGSGTEEFASLDVSGSIETGDDGSIFIILSNGEDDSRQYSVKLTFTSDVTEETDNSTEEGTPQVTQTSDTTYTEAVTDIITEKTTKTIRWHFAGMERIYED